SDEVRRLLVDAQRRVWAGTRKNQGRDVLDPKAGVPRHFRHRDGDPRTLAADGVCALYADRAGRIWVGTDNGLSRYEPRTDDFVNYGSPGSEAEFSNTHIRAIREDEAGVLWVGTMGGGLIRLDPGSGHVKFFRHDPQDPHSLSSDHVRSILEDDAHRLWVATADGLNLFDRAAETFVRYGNEADNPQSLRASYIMALYQDRGGVLWAGTRGGGASHWNPRSWLLG